ncbi:hypothetical protein DL768_008708 [Monosporascus sp. mg162]|nr:hypothetical protein DL768_008708 [Monosporascus sp. mg162]
MAEKPEKPEKPKAAVPENESDLKEEVILESENENVVTEPLVFNEWIAKKDKIPVPEEGLKANVANVILFGSEAYALTEAVRREVKRLKKMDLRAYIGYLVGYVASNIYRKYRGDQQQKLSIEIAELNDQIDSILILPKATTFLGIPRAIFSSDPLDTGVTGGVNNTAVHDTAAQGPFIENEEPVYDIIVVATGDSNPDPDQEARGVEADSDEESFDSSASNNTEEDPDRSLGKLGDLGGEDPFQGLPIPDATPGSEDLGHQQHHSPLPETAQNISSSSFQLR